MWKISIVCAAPVLCAACGGAGPTAPLTIASPATTIATDDSSFRAASGEVMDPPYYSHCAPLPTNPEGYKKLRDARRVHVQAEGVDLYGVLAICRLPRGATGPASRAYRLQVPHEYVAATEGGRVSVVFESVDVHGAPSEHPAWELWLSRSPLP
jgi:hypothetical protein